MKYLAAKNMLIDEDDAGALALPTSKIIAIIDLGSNSARMLLVQVAANGAYNILNRVKHMVRLGENSFEDKRLQEPAIQRTLFVLRSFMEMCRNYNVAEVLPMATAAVRDAENAQEFLQRVREKIGLDLKVISGQEEARLICLGVSSGMLPSLGLRMFMDIGGGSTEVAVANALEHKDLNSLKLGCVRLTNRFLSNHTDKVPAHVFEAMCKYVSSKASHTTGRMQHFNITELVGSSGTAQALHNVAHRLLFNSAPSSEQNILSIEGLRKACRHICGLTAEERRMLPGVSSRRAEVLVAGAAILLTLMEDFNFTQMTISTRNLQDGILIDYLQRRGEEECVKVRSVREQSIFQLATRCNYEQQHSLHMAGLALQLHDSAIDCGLMQLDHQARELLYYAAVLHDIGIFVAYSKHAAHGSYLIKNTQLLGFTDEEIDFMAHLVLLHNIKPTRKLPQALKEQGLSSYMQFFPLFLSLAENMERLHSQHVHETLFSKQNGKIVLIIRGRAISPVEMDAVQGLEGHVQSASGLDINIQFQSLAV